MELKLTDINKSYDKNATLALQNFTQSFTPGIYGLLGANGAGKSTLMNIITDNLKPDSGEITLDGTGIYAMGADYRDILGYMPQQQGLYDDFTGERFLWYMAALKGLKKKQAKETINHLLEVVSLQNARYQKIRSYSGGMKQRILIAQALLNDPKILIMDEPTAGLDPKERIRIRNFISEIAAGKIVLIATHVISDIEFIARKIILMQHGSIIQEGTPKELIRLLEGKVWNVYVDESELAEYEAAKAKIVNLMFTGEQICARILSEQKPQAGQAEPARPGLEDVYLYFSE